MDLTVYLTEEYITSILESLRALGPLPGFLLTFMKSFIPPLPTMVIVGVNAAIYGLWYGFFLSWFGIVSGCLVTFILIRKISGHPYFHRWSQRPKVQKSMLWVRNNAFSYVFLLGILPVGPFVFVNMVAAVARMPFRSFLIAVLFGKGLMVLSVSYIGHDLERFIRNPFELIYVVLFVGISLWISKKIEARFTRTPAVTELPVGNVEQG